MLFTDKAKKKKKGKGKCDGLYDSRLIKENIYTFLSRGKLCSDIKFQQFIA